MSTITRIKGVIDNPNLPVISPEGLVNPIYGKYISALAEQDYTLTTAQSTAIKAFINTITDNELAGYIQTIYPFIGSEANPNAAKVPILGDVLFDFADTFDGISYANGTINGITKCPNINTFKLSDIQTRKDFVGAAYSIIKYQGTTGLDNLMNFNDKYQIRFQNYRFAIYHRTLDGTCKATYAQDALDKSGAGYLSIAGMFDSTNSKYARYAKMNGQVSVTSGSQDFSISISDDDMNDTLLKNNKSWTLVQRLNCIVIFKEIMTKEPLSLFMEALDTLMTALGRNV